MDRSIPLLCGLIKLREANQVNRWASYFFSLFSPVTPVKGSDLVGIYVLHSKDPDHCRTSYDVMAGSFLSNTIQLRIYDRIIAFSNKYNFFDVMLPS